MLAEDMQVSLKRLALAILGLAALSVLAEGLIRLEMPLRQPGHLFAQLFSLALALGVFTALTDSRVVKWLRHQAVRSTRNALTLPLLLLLPYFIEAFGAGKFSWQGFLKLTAYILVPTLLLLPDRLRTAARLGWRDCAAMLALGVPVPAGWLQGIWFAFGGVPFFRPLYSVCIWLRLSGHSEFAGCGISPFAAQAGSYTRSCPFCGLCPRRHSVRLRSPFHSLSQWARVSGKLCH